MNVLHSLFVAPGEKRKNPNDPADMPYFRALRGIGNKAFMTWVTENGGGVLLNQMREKLVADIELLVSMEVNTMDKILMMVQKKTQILRDVTFIERIMSAFEEEEKRQEALKK